MADCFPLKSAIEIVTNWGFNPETIVSRLLKPLGGRLSHNVDSLGILGASEWVRKRAALGYRPTFLKKPPVQRVAKTNPQTSADQDVILDKEVKELLDKAAIKEVAPVQGQYVSSYFTVPKSKRTPDKWRPILNLKKFNKLVRHMKFHMEELKWVRKWL